MDSREYRRCLAECITEAARRGLIPTELRVQGSRHRLASMTTLAGAMNLLNSLAVSDWDQPRFMAVEALSPELNVCLSWLRKMERAEEYEREGMAELEKLRRKAMADLEDSRAHNARTVRMPMTQA